MSKKSEAIPTKTVGKSPVVVVYNDPSKRKKPKKNQSLNLVGKVADLPRPEFNIYKAKYEVKKLAISALKKTSKAEAQAQLAISLGAIPPKQKAINYKELKALQLKQKAQLNHQKETEEVFAARVSQMNKRRPPKNKNKVANFDANFGKRGGKTGKQKK